jgi:hypothetical protein
MEKRTIGIVTLSLVYIALCVAVVSATSASTYKFTPLGWSSQFPTVSDRYIAWSDDTYGKTGVINLYDTTTKKDKVIPSSHASNPEIAGTKLIWLDSSKKIPQIDLYDISSRTESTITGNIGKYTVPRMYGNDIVWDDGTNVYMRDISKHTQSIVISKATYPDIYGNTIAFISHNSQAIGDDTCVAVYNLNTKKTTYILDGWSVLYGGSPRIYGNNVIFGNSFTRLGFIQCYNLVTKKVTDVTADGGVNTLQGYQGSDAGCDTYGAQIYGNTVIYGKGGNDQYGLAGVHVKNLVTGIDTPVYLSNTNGQSGYINGYYEPAIYGNVIAWSDPNSNIIMAK